MGAGVPAGVPAADGDAVTTLDGVTALVGVCVAADVRDLELSVFGSTNAPPPTTRIAPSGNRVALADSATSPLLVSGGTATDTPTGAREDD